jgi:hypothetical protein
MNAKKPGGSAKPPPGKHMKRHPAIKTGCLLFYRFSGSGMDKTNTAPTK